MLHSGNLFAGQWACVTVLPGAPGACKHVA